MVAIFVVATILLLLGIELLRKRTVRKNTAAAPSEQFAIPKGYFLSKARSEERRVGKEC
jgi:hypothetical protein